MKIKTKILLIIILAGMLFNLSCKKQEKYSSIPHIEFINFSKVSDTLGYDNKGVIRFSFTDGDGDIGLGQDDINPPFDIGSTFYYNLFIDYYEKQNGVWKKELMKSLNNTDTIILSARIPRILPDGESKSIKGEIEDKFFINNYFSNYDTVAFEISIADRALHISNKFRTPEIIIKKN